MCVIDAQWNEDGTLVASLDVVGIVIWRLNADQNINNYTTDIFSYYPRTIDFYAFDWINSTSVILVGDNGTIAYVSFHDAISYKMINHTNSAIYEIYYHYGYLSYRNNTGIYLFEDLNDTATHKLEIQGIRTMRWHNSLPFMYVLLNNNSLYYWDILLLYIFYLTGVVYK